jgi:hypothetical protein
VPHRSRFASRLTLWAFAATLALKSAVPMLAAAAATLQGKPVAEICDVYGVATVAAAAPAAVMEHPPGHGHMHSHMAAPASSQHDAPAEHRHASRAGDHCALGGMVAIAAFSAPAVAALDVDDTPGTPASDGDIAAFDAAARWAALLGHGPPAFS